MWLRWLTHIIHERKQTMYNKNKSPLNEKVYLSSPTMHDLEMQYMEEAYKTNWMSTVGENINTLENQISKMTDHYAVALSSGTAALHMAMKLATERAYGKGETLRGHRVFCSDLTFDASINPILYEGGIPVFIDVEKDSWNMDPDALRKAFDTYPEVKIVALVHLYGTPANMGEIMNIINEHDAILIEDAAESMGATYKGKQTGTFGHYGCYSFNGNKIITGSSGGVLICKDEEDANKARKWSTQSRENAPWYQHEELGYNYRMSNVIAGVVRGQMNYLQEHINQKKDIYERYKEGLSDLPVTLNPLIKEGQANNWLTCLLIDEETMCPQIRDDHNVLYKSEKNKTCPHEILDALNEINAEGRPIWKPMHMQPLFHRYPFITCTHLGEDLFKRGLCLPSDNKMTPEVQDYIIDVIRACFE